MRFIGVDAPASAADAVATAFAESKGDIKTMLRTLFRNDAFRNSMGLQFKRPLHFVVSALRATNAEVADEMPLLRYLEKMGQAPFRYPTPDGYPLEASHWYSTLLWRWKFALALANNDIKATKVDRKLLDEALGGDSGLIATLLNRQPKAAESDGFIKSGDGLALLLASPAFQRC
jgi:uncharacterized protein (DUF1800 family)